LNVKLKILKTKKAIKSDIMAFGINHVNESKNFATVSPYYNLPLCKLQDVESKEMLIERLLLIIT